MTVKTFWLSFVKDGAFAGVAVVDVAEPEARAEKAVIDQRFPQHAPGAEWIAAATRKAHALGCNPGGEVGAVELSDGSVRPDKRRVVAALPRGVLMQRAELLALGALDDEPATHGEKEKPMAETKKDEKPRTDLTYLQAMHAIQSGIAVEIGRDPKAVEPKHLRVGINSALVNDAALVRLLIAKGVFTEAEYLEELRLEACREVDRMEDRYNAGMGVDGPPRVRFR